MKLVEQLFINEKMDVGVGSCVDNKDLTEPDESDGVRLELEESCDECRNVQFCLVRLQLSYCR